jgi:hypothetical protein
VLTNVILGYIYINVSLRIENDNQEGQMKLNYSIWAIVAEFIFLIPYVFKILAWDLFATLACVSIVIEILVNIIYILVNMMKKYHIR